MFEITHEGVGITLDAGQSVMADVATLSDGRTVARWAKKDSGGATVYGYVEFNSQEDWHGNKETMPYDWLEGPTGPGGAFGRARPHGPDRNRKRDRGVPATLPDHRHGPGPRCRGTCTLRGTRPGTAQKRQGVHTVDWQRCLERHCFGDFGTHGRARSLSDEEAWTIGMLPRAPRTRGPFPRDAVASYPSTRLPTIWRYTALTYLSPAGHQTLLHLGLPTIAIAAPEVGAGHPRREQSMSVL